MRYLSLSSVQVRPDRQRQFFDPQSLADLQSSIERIGLIQPLVITAEGELVAGERRLKCLTNLAMLGHKLRFNGEELAAGLVPAVLPAEADALTYYEIELEENIQRQDLAWQEKAEAIRRLHELRGKQATRAGLIHTVADTAEEVTGRRDGSYQDNTRKALIVARNLADPDVAKARTQDEAFKILKRKTEAAQNAERATGVKQMSSRDRHLAVQGDCLHWGWEWVEGKAELFDVICTDPPYGMDAGKFNDAGGSYAAITHQYADDQASWRELMNSFAQLSWAITKPQAHLYLCCDIDGFSFLRNTFATAGWRVHRTPLVNVKKNANRVPWPRMGPRRCYELVLYAVKGDRPTTAIYPDVFETSGDDNLGHGAQKPVEMWLNLLRRSVRSGDRVLDPFAGTGGLVVAAHQLDCNATIIEQEAQYFGIVLKRLEELK
ncbi:MAG: adenine specific methyltransferase [Siphoviridae sp. ctdEk19]|nr:MAG: adenine specific methyltransferase [Siphoviridae sp. ctdEk19]